MKELLLSTNIYMAKPEEFIKSTLEELKDKNIILFMTESSVERFSLKSWIDNLRNSSSLTWINKIKSNPTYIDIYDALSVMKGRNNDIVLAIGGGSAIDMAKASVALSYLNEKEELNKKDVLESIKTKRYLKNPTNIPIFAVPTTAGTGSEVTKWATVWDLEGGVKYSVDAPYLLPKRAYIIPEYTVTKSRRLTLSTGLDALCQAVEAYWAKATNPMVRELSKTAIRLLVEFLPKVLKDTSNIYYREKVFLGSLYSGLAFSNTRTTACHSISYPLTMKFGIEHGLACIISLPMVMEKNINAIDEAEELLEVLKIKNTEGLQKWLDELSEGIVSLKLSSFGIKESDIDELVKMSFTLGRMDNNPVEILPKDVREILEVVL